MSRKIEILTAILLLFFCCTNKDNNTLAVKYLQEGELKTQIIPLGFIKEGKIKSLYIDSIKFSILDSVSYPEGNPNKTVVHSTPLTLDFSKKIEAYSPEYYSVYTVYNITKAIEYYNKLFDNKIDFDFEKKYRKIEISFGDIPLLTTPNNYIFEKGSNPSPSLFYHEIGHRAFWYIEDGLNIKFNGLSYIHMGLLEYYTASLNNFSIIGEGALPPKSIRNASWIYGYPPADSLTLRSTMESIKESYPKEMKNPQSNISKFYAASMASYKNYMHIIDNHKGGMIITSTLWRIREQIGQEKMDKLVTQTILDLNSYMEQRSNFYQLSEKETLPNKIEWYDLFYGLIQKDKELFDGKHQQVIIKEFEKTNFPVNQVKLSGVRG